MSGYDILRVAAILFGLTLPGAVAARDFLSPWQPGRTLQQVSDDQQRCMQTARGVEQQTNSDERARRAGRPSTSPPPGSKAWLAPGLDGQTAFFAGYYYCLRTAGYSIRRWPSRDYAATRRLPDGGTRIMQASIAPDSPHAEVPPGTVK